MNIKTLIKRPAITIAEDDRIGTAQELMRRTGIQHLPVVRGADVVGMLTEHDVLAASESTLAELSAYDWRGLLVDLRVRDVMFPRPIVLTADVTVAEAARLARHHRVNAFPVVDGGEVVGVVTTSDLLGVLVGLLEARENPGPGHVLVATSLRPGSQLAMAHAVRLASATGASLTALHVVGSGRHAPADGSTTQPSRWADRARQRIARTAIGAMRGTEWIVDVYALRYSGDTKNAVTKTDETIAWHSVHPLPAHTISNIPWLVHLSLDKMQNDQFHRCDIRYKS